MRKKKRKVIPLLAACCLLSCLSAVPVFAASGALDITQKVSSLTESVQDQEYTFSYQSDGEEYEGGTVFETAFGDGFQAKTLTTGDWSDYEGNLIVSLYPSTQADATPVYRNTAGENESVDVSAYEGVKRITVATDTAVSATTNMDGVKVEGTIDANASGNMLTVSSKYSGSLDGNSFQELASKSIDTDCSIYVLDKPTVSVNSTSLDVFDSMNATVSGIGGNGNGTVTSFIIHPLVPSRMIIDRITLPDFEGSSIKLMIDGVERRVNADGTYNVSKKDADIQVEVTTNGNAISQTRDMVLEMRNTSSAAGEESIRVSIQASMSDASSVSIESDAAAFHCNEAVDPEPDPEPEPDPDPSPGPDPVPDPGTGTTPEKPNGGQGGQGSQGNEDEEPELTPEPPKKPVFGPTVIDFTGLNLQGSRADGSTKAVATVKQTDEGRTSTLQSALSDRVQTTRVFDFTSESDDTQDAQDVEEAQADTIEFGGGSVADKIDKADKGTTDKIKEAASESRILPIILILLGVLAAGGAIVFFLFREKGKQIREDEMDDEAYHTEEIAEEGEASEPPSNGPGDTGT